MKKVAIAVLGLIGIVAALGLVKAAQIGAMIEAGQQAGPPPESVAVAEVDEQVWAPGLKAVGTVLATRGVTVSSEVPGLVSKLHFDSGQRVDEGQVLVQLDASIERAQLRSARATAELAKVTLRRAKRLSAQKVNAPAELDTAVAEAGQAVAQVANIEAQIAKKTIRAPFAGQLGIRQINLGQILSAGTPIVSLQDLDEVYVDFFLPQQDLSKVAAGQQVELRVDAAPGRVWRGRVQSVEPSVEQATRSVQVRASFKNEDGRLRPGMFVKARVALPPGPAQVIVPVTAVVFAPYGNSVYVVEQGESPPPATPSAAEANGESTVSPERAMPPAGPQWVARQVFVKLGERRGDFVAVESGLSKGMQVVTAGAFKLRNGAAVVIDTKDSVTPQVAPTPKDS